MVAELDRATPGQPPVLATDVIAPPGLLPRNLRLDWRATRRHFDCSCGWDVGEHPLCAVCGIAIGPGHYQTQGAEIDLEVYRDYFDEHTGVWRVERAPECRLVCSACYLNAIDGQLHVQPIRVLSRVHDRLAQMNRWRRQRRLPALHAGDPPPPGFGQPMPLYLDVACHAKLRMTASLHLRARAQRSFPLLFSQSGEFDPARVEEALKRYALDPCAT